MKELEFEIVDNKRLDVIDFSWYLDDINSIYIAKTNNANYLYPELGIFIETDFETDMLYYKTDDEIKISREYKKLIAEIKAVNPNFKMIFPDCYNLKNVKSLKYRKGIFYHKVLLNFKNKSIEVMSTKKKIEELLKDYNQLQDNNINI